jgi:tetratricopeptide (TPR) repeat protein
MRWRTACAAAMAAVAFSSCDQLFDQGTKSNIEAAEKKAAAGDFRSAVKLYEAALDGTPKSADVHYKLAVIYDERLKSPVSAQHHFRRYLEFSPNGIYAKEAKAYEREAEQKLVRSLNKGALLSQQDAVRLKNDNLLLRKQVAELRAQKNPPPPAGSPAASRDKNAQKPIPAGSRTHVVEPGETLASIAQRYYKNKTRWKDIQDANFYSLEGTAKIKAGQTLIIP